MDFVRHELRQMVVSYNTAQTLVYDIETCKVVTKLDSAKSYGKWYLCGGGHWGGRGWMAMMWIVDSSMQQLPGEATKILRFSR